MWKKTPYVRLISALVQQLAGLSCPLSGSADNLVRSVYRVAVLIGS